jgi:hypothetical protein
MQKLEDESTLVDVPSFEQTEPRRGGRHCSAGPLAAVAVGDVQQHRVSSPGHLYVSSSFGLTPPLPNTLFFSRSGEILVWLPSYIYGAPLSGLATAPHRCTTSAAPASTA